MTEMLCLLGAMGKDPSLIMGAAVQATTMTMIVEDTT